MAALITAGIFLPPVFMATAGPLGFGLGSVAAGALSGAVASGGLSILAGEKPKDFLKSAAFGAAMGALGGKLQQGKFDAKAFQQTVAGAPPSGIVETQFGTSFVGDAAGQNALAQQFGAQLVTDASTGVVTPVFPGQYQATFADAATGAKGGVSKLVEGSSLAQSAADAGIGASSKFGDYATQAAITAGVNTGMNLLTTQITQEDPPVKFGGSAGQYYQGVRNAVANLTRNYISSGSPSGDSTAAIYASMANNLSYGTGSIDYNQHASLGLMRGINVPSLQYT